MFFKRRCQGILPDLKLFDSGAERKMLEMLELHFFCDRPTPDISWQKDGGELPSSRTTIHDFQRKLRVSNVNEADAGDYRCTATNSLGTIHHVTKVTVKGRQYLLDYFLLPRSAKQVPFIIAAELVENNKEYNGKL